MSTDPAATPAEAADVDPAEIEAQLRTDAVQFRDVCAIVQRRATWIESLGYNAVGDLAWHSYQVLGQQAARYFAEADDVLVPARRGQ